MKKITVQQREQIENSIAYAVTKTKSRLMFEPMQAVAIQTATAEKIISDFCNREVTYTDCGLFYNFNCEWIALIKHNPPKFLTSNKNGIYIATSDEKLYIVEL